MPPYTQGQNVLVVYVALLGLLNAVDWKDSRTAYQVGLMLVIGTFSCIGLGLLIITCSLCDTRGLPQEIKPETRLFV